MVLRWNVDRVQNIKVNGVKNDGFMSVDDVNYDVMTRKWRQCLQYIEPSENLVFLSEYLFVSHQNLCCQDPKFLGKQS